MIKISISDAARISFLVLCSCGSGSAVATETVTYSYDAQGRIVEAAHTGSGPNAALDIQYQYDLAGNRTTQTVTDSRNAGQQVILTPVNGFTITPINP